MCVVVSTQHTCVCVTVLGVSVSVCANTSSVRVCVYVTEECVCKCPHAHITIERSLRQSCLGVYCVTWFMADGITTPVPYSLKVHRMASVPRASPGSDVAGWYLGWLFLQLLPLVSNKHPISLSSAVALHASQLAMGTHGSEFAH